jgi:hypothetical protein
VSLLEIDSINPILDSGTIPTATNLFGEWNLCGPAFMAEFG